MKRADQRSTRMLWGGMLAGGLIATGIALAPGFRTPAEETVAPVNITPNGTSRPVAAPAIEELRLRVIRKYPHATDAFTQGLIWHEGVMYESTGQYGRSSLRKVRLEDGKVLAQRKLGPKFFGEGLERVGERLIQLTWRSGFAFVSELSTLEARETLSYRGEGWGLCYDGTALVMSDGSSMLEFRDPESMELLGEVSVLKNGHPVRQINELEGTNEAGLNKIEWNGTVRRERTEEERQQYEEMMERRRQSGGGFGRFGQPMDPDYVFSPAPVGDYRVVMTVGDVKFERQTSIQKDHWVKVVEQN